MSFLFLLLKYEHTIKDFQTSEDIICDTIKKEEEEIKDIFGIRNMIAEIKNPKVKK